jgi:hypothetical protein
LLAMIADARHPERTRIDAVTVLLAFPDVDVAAAVLARTGRAAPTAAQMVEAAARLDPIEAYEALRDAYRTSAELRVELANKPNAARDPRFVDEALRFVATEPRPACKLLRACGERGRMELLDIVEKAQSMHDIARAASDELRALGDDGAMSAVADLVRRTR